MYMREKTVMIFFIVCDEIYIFVPCFLYLYNVFPDFFY